MKYLLIALLLASCARAPITRIDESMRLASSRPVFTDTLSKESFFIALRKHIDVMKSSRMVMPVMTFGPTKIPKEKYIASLEAIFANQDNWQSYIYDNFDFMEVYGKDEWSEVMATGYYEPLVRGSKKKTDLYSQPMYGTPNDLITIDLKKFAHKFSKNEKLESLTGRVDNKKFVPYYDRKNIDVDMKLKGQNLELAWVDPVDSFFIQIQGSGVVEFEDGEKMRVGYAAQNGHAYIPIGKFLTHAIPLESMSMQRIKEHLATLSEKDKQDVLNKNPSYVFFRKLDSLALTYAGMEVSDGRTIATDLHLFPKGAMAFLDVEEPVFANLEDLEPKSWMPAPRLVFDQDTGGAIRGAGRVDLYFGQGAEASHKAGVMKQKGRLYYLVPKSLN